MTAVLLMPILGIQGHVQKTRHGATERMIPGCKGYEFQVPDIDNVPDLHGNPTDAQLGCLLAGTSSLCYRN